jgi:rubrerythrin
MTVLEKLQALTDEQKQQLNTLTTAGEVSAFAEENSIDLTSEEASEIAVRLTGDAMDEVAGGSISMSTSLSFCVYCGNINVNNAAKCPMCGGRTSGRAR